MKSVVKEKRYFMQEVLQKKLQSREKKAAEFWRPVRNVKKEYFIKENLLWLF
jgi:hypothetical protein